MAASAPRIPGFSFIRDIGHGGFADVYLYEQKTPRREVAVKVLHSEVAGSEAAVRLNKEADAMAGLSQHQNIVTVFQSGIADDGRPYLVMDYYPGPALSEGLRQSQKPLDAALRIGIQLAGALESAHRISIPGSSPTSQGILHRDIKPANILVDRWGRPVLGDFGIAMPNAEAERGGAQGMSIPWSPPESFDMDPHPSPQSDVWSLAATVYALLTGRAPFEIAGGDNKTHSMIHRIRNEPYWPLGRVDAPPSLDQVLSTAMAKDPQARYHSMKAFGMALREVEVELHLPPTQMDILDDSAWDDTGEDVDFIGTSLRPIAVIDPSVPVMSTTPGGWMSDPGAQIPDMGFIEPLDRTQLRSPLSSIESDGDEVQRRASGSYISSENPVNDDEPSTKTSRFVIGAIFLILVSIIVVIVVVHGSNQIIVEDPPTETSSVQDPVGVALPLPPTDVQGTIDLENRVAEFTWVNPEPREGDKYSWEVIGEDFSAGVSATEHVTVELAEDRTWVCIEVFIVRDGVGSRSTEGCAT